MIQVPRLVGDLVLVREVTHADAPALFELLSDPRVAEHLSPPPPSAEAFAGFIDWTHRERAAGKSICFAIVPHGMTTAVGMIQIRALEPTWFTAEWGFAVGAAFWSTGIFIQAAALVADFAFSALKTHRIEARAVADNARAHAALQKLGARVEGTLAKAFRKGGRLDKQLLWAITSDEWREGVRLSERVTSADAMAHVARAIAATQPPPAEQPRVTPSPKPAQPYPFFLTETNAWGAAIRSQRESFGAVKTPPRIRTRPSVLIIDDNLTQLDLYAMVVEEVADVRRATRGEDGYAAALKTMPDAIITDILLPDIDGLTVCRRLRDNPETASIPLIVLTGDEGAYARAQGEALEFSAILMKPCPASLLLSVVRAATDAEHRSASSGS